MAQLPPEVAAAASNSIGAAGRIAAELPAEAGANLLGAAQQAFVDAMGVAIFIPIALALVGAVLIARFMPAEHGAEVSTEQTREEQPRTSGRPAPARGRA